MTTFQPDFSLQTERQGGVVTIRVTGDLEYGVSDELVELVREELVPPAGRSGPRELRVDCGATRFVDSMGLSALLMLRRIADDAGVRLVLEHFPDALLRLMDMTGTLQYLTGTESAREAADPAPSPRAD
ncbi:STAS domain-containing protein [Streptomyces sp. NPDC001941]|uniref:STAS domain-containing protein n=1 Tax=Streptomyces sp. NPDC001941 TaxID=3154659 RepID=UPI00332C6747